MRRLFLLPILLLQSCGTMGFYGQGIAGQFEILRKSRANHVVIEDKATSQAVREKLILCKELCEFAKNELNLPGDDAYHKYADLGRKHVVYVVQASPEFSLEPKAWRYPIVGELDYRGYFDEEAARKYADKLESEGYDVHLGGTDAYSTLGFFHDPVLNTFIDYSETDFADLIFHELTHRRFFRSGETTFNESLANAVAEEGVRRWLASKGNQGDLANYEKRLVKRREFYSEIERTRALLEKLYASSSPEAEMRARKADLMAELKQRAAALQKRWGGQALKEWISKDITNAHLLVFVTYHEQIPKFQKLLAECGGDFESFFARLEDDE